MNTDDKILKILEDLQAGQQALNGKVGTLEQGQKALQADVASIKDVQQQQGKDIAALKSEQGQQGKLLNGLAATMATVLEEQHAQRLDIRSLHTELHETREELKGEIRAAREEAKRDTIDLKATVVKKIQSVDRRVTNIEEHEGIENPDKN
jgi:predicted XRE-type DNA-binding protein